MKKGFTIIEIILSIALIVTIGTGFTFFVINTNKNKEIDILIANESNFSNALEVYLSKNSYVVDNIYDNAEGAVISLEVLKNEGLIKDNLDIDYENNYYVISNAFLGTNNLGENVVKEECENSIGLEKIASWASSNDTTDVLYFCPKTNTVVSGINDPYNSCGENDERLYCKVINNAKNTEEIYSDLTETNIIEGDSSKMTSFNNEYTVYREKPLTDIKDGPMILATTNRAAFSSSTYIEEFEIGKEILPRGLLYLGGGLAGASYYQADDNYEIISQAIGGLTIKNLKDWTFSDEQNFTKLDFNGIKALINKYVIFGDPGYRGAYTYSLCQILNVQKIEGNKVRIKYKAFLPDAPDRRGYTYYTSYDVDIEKTLSKTEDEYGYSYYFRGDIKDNYVNFNNMCWRILRIEGDGSIKIILESKYSTCDKMNENLDESSKTLNVLDDSSEYGYIGHEYDRKRAINYNWGGGIRFRLLSWLNANFSENSKNYLKSEKRCLGNLTIKSTSCKYGFCATYNEENPSLKCQDDDYIKTFNDYITTLTVDEAYFAGLTNSTVYEPGDEIYSFLKPDASFCNNWNSHEGGNGYDCATYFTLTAEADMVYFITRYGYIEKSEDNARYSYGPRRIRPVIVLKNDIKYSSGRGTQTNPYVID